MPPPHLWPQEWWGGMGREAGDAAETRRPVLHLSGRS